MRLPSTDPTLEISTTSGMLRATVHPARSWPVVLLELGVIMVVAVIGYQDWARMSRLLRDGFVFAMASSVLGLIFQFSGSEAIEIDTGKITLCKDIHGWERKREYAIGECRELEWRESTEKAPQRLQFEIRFRTITFAKDLTENQAIRFLTTLQQTLPNVAQQRRTLINAL